MGGPKTQTLIAFIFLGIARCFKIEVDETNMTKSLNGLNYDNLVIYIRLLGILRKWVKSKWVEPIRAKVQDGLGQFGLLLFGPGFC